MSFRALEGAPICAKKHDHTHRWKAIVDRLGLSEDYRMGRREEELARKLNEFEYPTRHAVQRAHQNEQ